MHQTWSTLGVSVFYSLENGLSSDFHFSVKKVRSCSLCWSQSSGSYTSYRDNPHTKVTLLRAGKSASLHKASLFPPSQSRFLTDREMYREGELSGDLQIDHNEDSVFLPEKQITKHVCGMLMQYGALLLTFKLNQNYGHK